MKRKRFEELRQKMNPERRAENEKRTRLALLGLALQELRQDYNITQAELAEKLGMQQSALSQIEDQEDIEISTLSRYIEGLGGKLTLTARFPDRDVVISQFD